MEMDPSDGFDGASRERWAEERTTFQRVYDVVTTLSEPVTATTVAERADCSETGARNALGRLVELGVATRSDGRPATYQRNESYFEWRRVERLAREHSAADLRERLDELVSREEQLRDEYGVPSPDAVAATPTDHDEIHALRDDLTEWRTIQRDLRIVQRALQRAESRTGAPA
ncbi:DUF7342 family protein [Haloglomus litoreum]|uniref:DUF7342 family protein n=1 Tax=Haloglomus litoreum TaxID=3034026 RepID=UPI0023E8F1EB|nr:hypothetical protein [Haloglomus sp. DT116]